MPAEGFDSSNAYLDQVSILASVIEYPGSSSPPSEEYEVVFNPGDLFDLDWLTAELEDFFRLPPDENGFRMQARDFVLRQSRTHYSWGADATTAEYVLQVAQVGAGIAGVLTVEELLKALASRLQGRVQQLRHGAVDTDLSETEISGMGARLIETHFENIAGTLCKFSTATDYANRTFEFSAEDTQGDRYSVTFTSRGGQPELRSKAKHAAA